MTPMLLIAWREYRQYVFSRGFLLFLIMFPLGFVFAGAAISFAERAKPPRHFVVFDETGVYGDAIDREIENRARRRVLAAWDAYLAFAVEADALADGRIAPPFAPGDVTAARASAFEAAGGVTAAERAAAPFLRDGAPGFAPPRDIFIRVSTPPDVAAAGSVDEAADRLRAYLNGDGTAIGPDGAAVALFAAILIPRDFGVLGENASDAEKVARQAQYWSRNLTDDSLRGAIARALDTAVRRQKIASLGLGAETLDDIIDTEAPLTAFRPDRAEDEAELGVKDRVEVILPGALTYMLVFIIMGIGNLLLTNTIEERSNKIVEVLLSSVTADELMLGKLIGIGAVGLTLPTVFLLGGFISAMAFPAANEFLTGVYSTLFATPLFAIYIFYFLCAYAIFAMIFLAIGAVSNSLQDAQSYMGPVSLMLFAPLPFVMVMYQNPNGLIASILTWIPIYTPYAVLLRVAADPPLWEIIGATALMLIFAYFLSRLMGRIFRRAILQSAPPKAKDLVRLALRRDS